MSLLFAKNAPIFWGLVLGTMGKFGRMIAVGEPFSFKQVIGHCLMMGVCGLVAMIATDASHITDPNGRAFAAAVLAIAASDIIQWLASRAWQKFLQTSRDEIATTEAAIIKARGEFRQTVQIAESAARLNLDQERKGEGE